MLSSMQNCTGAFVCVYAHVTPIFHVGDACQVQDESIQDNKY